MHTVYATSHCQVYAHALYSRLHSLGMKPHELVNALYKQRKDISSVSALARAMHNQAFQGTLHKFLTGQVPHPTASTAGKIAKFFQLPLEALYDSKVATRVAKERGLIKEGALTARVDEDESPYRAPPQNWPFKNITATQITGLSPAALHQLERLIAAYIGGPLPAFGDHDSWREVAHTLAGSMDRDIGKPVFVEFCKKVDEILPVAAKKPSALVS